MSYAEKLKHPKWQKKRLSILNRDEFTCRLCADTETQLQVHHLKYTGTNPHDAADEDLITLCRHCHKFIEDVKSKQEFEFPIRLKKEMHPKKDMQLIMAITGNYTFFYLYFESTAVQSFIIPNDVFSNFVKFFIHG